jgi:hypothetical protein
MASRNITERWPELPYIAWKNTRDALHLWTQVVGKVRLTLTPWLNHSWHVALYVTARGLTTSPIPWRGGDFQIDFDFIDHVLWVRLSEGQFRQVMLKPMSVAEFYEDVMIALRELGIEAPITTMPCEIADCIPFDEDTVHAAYDADYANRFWRVLLAAQEVFGHFRTGFLGKASPVHYLLGKLRSGRDAFFRTSGTASPWRCATSAECRRAGGLFARGFERRLLAGWGRADRLRGVLFLRLSGAGRFCDRQGETCIGVFHQAAGRVSASLRCRAWGKRSRCRSDGILAEHV